jgi:Protein of unknown function (DUF2948)
VAQRQPIRLAAEDADDLSVISAALQDAVAQLGDFSFDSKTRRFTAILNRFRWEDGPRTQGWRTRSALDVSGILKVQSKRLKQDAPEAIVSLLSLTFEPGEAPGGSILLAFSGGGELRLEIECIDALLVDVAEPWPAKNRPKHETGK